MDRWALRLTQAWGWGYGGLGHLLGLRLGLGLRA